MWNLVTLDGLFEGPNRWDLDWHDYVWGEELEQRSIDQLRSAAEWSNTRLVKTDAPDEVTKLKGQPGKNLFIFGRAEREA
jgi:hypothetical protein